MLRPGAEPFLVMSPRAVLLSADYLQSKLLRVAARQPPIPDPGGTAPSFSEALFGSAPGPTRPRTFRSRVDFSRFRGPAGGTEISLFKKDRRADPPKTPPGGVPGKSPEKHGFWERKSGVFEGLEPLNVWNCTLQTWFLPFWKKSGNRPEKGSENQ